MWKNQEAAKSFYSGPWLDGIRARYGNDPRIDLLRNSGVYRNFAASLARHRLFLRSLRKSCKCLRLTLVSKQFICMEDGKTAGLSFARVVTRRRRSWLSRAMSERLRGSNAISSVPACWERIIARVAIVFACAIQERRMTSVPREGIGTDVNIASVIVGEVFALTYRQFGPICRTPAGYVGAVGGEPCRPEAEGSRLRVMRRPRPVWMARVASTSTMTA